MITPTMINASSKPAKRTFVAAAAVVTLALCGFAAESARAQDASYAVTLKDGKFTPDTLEVKAGTKFQVVVTNASAKPAEFESAELKREKVVAAGASATVAIGPLKAGTYPFHDDFNKAAIGKIIAK
jgi:plastocyanin